MFLPRQTPAQSQDRDDTWKKCRGNDADVRLAACSAVDRRAARRRRPSSPARTTRAAVRIRQKSLFTLALDDFNAAIKANPALSDAYGDRGITLTILGRFADAIPDFTRVIEAYPRLAYAHYNRGICYELIGLDDLAIEDISASIEIEPRAEFRFERRGTIYFRKNLLDKALADYEEALVINPQYAAALYGRGIIRIRKGDLAGGGADIAAGDTSQAEHRRRNGPRRRQVTHPNRARSLSPDSCIPSSRRNGMRMLTAVGGTALAGTVAWSQYTSALVLGALILTAACRDAGHHHRPRSQGRRHDCGYRARDRRLGAPRHTQGDGDSCESQARGSKRPRASTADTPSRCPKWALPDRGRASRRRGHREGSRGDRRQQRRPRSRPRFRNHRRASAQECPGCLCRPNT